MDSQAETVGLFLCPLFPLRYQIFKFTGIVLPHQVHVRAVLRNINGAALVFASHNIPVMQKFWIRVLPSPTKNIRRAWIHYRRNISTKGGSV